MHLKIVYKTLDKNENSNGERNRGRSTSLISIGQLHLLCETPHLLHPLESRPFICAFALKDLSLLHDPL